MPPARRECLTHIARSIRDAVERDLNSIAKDKSTPSTTTPAKRQTSLGTVLANAMRQISVVLLVGLAITTVFTAWTPSPPGGRDGLSGFVPPTPTTVAEADIPNLIPATPTPVRSHLIGIVAGHKGSDSGAVCPDGLSKASVNLGLATRLKVAGAASGGGYSPYPQGIILPYSNWTDILMMGSIGFRRHPR